jgi:ABC-2 type transport system permease protein
VKEFIQMRRDRLTFGMMIGIPMIQLMLFGYAINSDPKHLPTARAARRTTAPFARTLIAALAQQRATSTSRARRETRGRERTRCCGTARCSSSMTIPVDFSRAARCAANGRRCCSKPTRPIPPADGLRARARRRSSPTTVARTAT